MAAMTPGTTTNYTLTSRQRSNQSRTVPSESTTPTLALRRSTTATYAVAAGETLTLTVSAETYFMRVGIIPNATGTVTAARVTHQNLLAAQGFVADQPGGITIPPIAASGSYDTGLIPVMPTAPITLTLTGGVAVGTVYVYEYGYKAVSPNTLMS